jgi:hypothetical protein
MSILLKVLAPVVTRLAKSMNAALIKSALIRACSLWRRSVRLRHAARGVTSSIGGLGRLKIDSICGPGESSRHGSQCG